MGENKKVVIKIQGKDFCISGDEDEEYMKKIAYYVDRKLSQVSTSNPNLDSLRAAILSSLNIADELFKAVVTIEELRKKIGEKVEKNPYLEIEKIQNEDLPVPKGS